jgi:hypothetical protein
MIALLMIALVASVVIYLVAYKLHRKWRFLAAGVTFAVLGMLPLAYILIVGDQMPDDARLVTEEELKRAAESAP